MAMTPRQRLLTALDNGRADRMPGQVHNWQPYYLDHYLDGVDQYAAYERFGLDAVIYAAPVFGFDEGALENWRFERTDGERGTDGRTPWKETITTPEGVIWSEGAGNDITRWCTRFAFDDDAAADLFLKYCPTPTSIDWSPVEKAVAHIGDRGIVRHGPHHFGQGSPWQSLCRWMGTQAAIFAAIDRPAWVHGILEAMLQRTLAAFELGGWDKSDLVETGGGAGSNTVLSPAMHREFCLPYDRAQHDAIHKAAARVVYHLCGGLMDLLEIVVENGTDGLETMTPVSMGGDCDLAEASRRVGEDIFFIGGFDQNVGFETGTPDDARRLVGECFEATRDHAGFICSPSDHFFRGDPANVQAFTDALAECVY